MVTANGSPSGTATTCIEVTILVTHKRHSTIMRLLPIVLKGMSKLTDEVVGPVSEEAGLVEFFAKGLETLLLDLLRCLQSSIPDQEEKFLASSLLCH